MPTRDLSYLRTKVFQCFPAGVPPPKLFKLRDAVTEDNWGVVPKDWPDEKWRSWDEIPDELLAMAECLLTYFGGTELVYCLPRFILRLLDEMEAGRTSLSNESDSLIFHLVTWHSKSYLGLPLRPDQRKLLGEIVELARNDPDLKWTVESALQLYSVDYRCRKRESSKDSPEKPV